MMYYFLLVSILRQYCERTGMEYEDGLVHWNHLPEDQALFKDWDSRFFQTVLTTCTFQTPSDAGSGSSHKEPDLPKDVQADIENSLVFYHKLFNKRILP